MAAGSERQGAVQKLGHVPALNGLRGLAILLVLGYHLSYALPSGLIGVDVFFGLSGFLITTLLLEERDKTGRVNFRAFYARRARRLLPGLAVYLVVLAVVYASLDQWASFPNLLAVLFYVGNLVRVASGHTLSGGLGQMWSLAEEEQFYLVWPGILLWSVARFRGFALARALACLAITVALWRTVDWLVFGATAHTLLSPDTRSDALLLGCALAVGRHAGLRPARWLVVAGAPAALIGIFVVSATFNEADAVAAIPLTALLTSIVLVGAIEAGSPIARFLSFPAFVYLGAISYSVYVWHLLIFETVHGSRDVVLGAAIAAGAASYHFIESPFRRRLCAFRGDASTAPSPAS